MKLTINSVYGKELYSAEADSVGILLNMAAKDLVSLYGAYLYGAYLKGANLEGAYLNGDTTIETGETWNQYLVEVLPALLTAGGRPISDVLMLQHWTCHSWENCPIAAAFQADGLSGVPMLLRPRAQQFIRLFDAKLIPLEVVGKGVTAHV